MKTNKKSFFLFIILFFIFSISLHAQEYHKVTRVIDGDTFVIENGEHVRFIGIDTPETVKPNTPVQYYGKEASNFTKKLLTGKKVRLDYDFQIRDKYSRLLAYVYLDSLFVNAELARLGYARLMTIPPDTRYSKLFEKLINEAKQKKLGLWKTKSK